MRIINLLSRIMNMVAGGILAAMMVLTVSDVFLRYFFKRPILGATEITESLMVCLAFFGLAWCAAQRSHLKVDLVMSIFSSRTQAVSDALTGLAGLVMVALITWRNFTEAIAIQELNIVSSLIKIPAFPFYYVIALGCAVLFLVMFTQVIQEIGKVVRG
ncbi:MAG: TRAP transporter small permease [Deltaproteobacteria bacterium]|nr:TRAP transporter small permease [Deltaproteobacteria bacterium]